ncbi:MAG: triose-phosphate isomerase [Bacteroidales bacterium]|nr:triose-phosphate isomerase [Bacteroidales bacterium]MCR4858315.1 triose-phosphate isomerase [Bacteroidales bacterium]
MKPKIVIGNWKMNKNFDEAEDLITEITEKLEGYNLETEVVLCPPMLYAELVTDHANEEGAPFYAGVQNVSEYENGAYTGEVSAEMLANMDVSFCIVGHSERRKYFGETNAIVLKKMQRLLANDIVPVMCCGESLDERKADKHFEVVQKQIEETLYELTPDQMERTMVAYEPIWAIGTGETATPAQAEEMLAFIRSAIEKKFGTEMAVNTYILYGGSCNAKNALELFSQQDVDGGLIGGASLKADDFVKIIEAGETVIKDN